MKDYQLLVLATAKIYQRAALGALRSVAQNWRVFVLHIPAFILTYLVMIVASLFGPLAGGFIIGMFLAWLVAGYLGCVEAGVTGDRIDFSEAVPKANQLWSPVIGVFFVMFILQFFSNNAFINPEQQWIKMAVSFLVALLFNPLPEIIYQRPHGSLQMFGESYQFMLENFIEWMLPFALIGAVVYLWNPELAIALGTLTMLSHPLRMIETLFLIFRSAISFYAFVPLVIVGIIFLYVFFVFRGILYKELSTSTRRKRIYQQKFS